ncbi:hypothetical protein C8J57DRAFT_1520184 [Mycena rebaudengoi]|nr:hypothetical protein C8J57DRAFT_1520184 [Mycena rebaudengoi]
MDVSTWPDLTSLPLCAPAYANSLPGFIGQGANEYFFGAEYSLGYRPGFSATISATSLAEALPIPPPSASLTFAPPVPLPLCGPVPPQKRGGHGKRWTNLTSLSHHAHASRPSAQGEFRTWDLLGKDPKTKCDVRHEVSYFWQLCERWNLK